MGQFILPKHYTPSLDVLETQRAIKQLKDTFERRLAEQLGLMRVSAPICVRPETGLNDNLNGVERPVCFDVPAIDAEVEIVQSLAKWKRLALHRYGFAPHTGLYTDMNAIRRDETLDNIHSIYVDQWDWERVITAEERDLGTLRWAATQIVEALALSEEALCKSFPSLHRKVPSSLFFISTEALAKMYPTLSRKEREDAICREKKGVCITGIGWPLADGAPHDGRAPDYDDWNLNCDILVYNSVLDSALELSSMGVRVDAAAMRNQLAAAGCEERGALPFHKMVLDDTLPLTMGGGVGQSRLCMFVLEKAHIGEVQAAPWPKDVLAACEAANVPLL